MPQGYDILEAEGGYEVLEPETRQPTFEDNIAASEAVRLPINPYQEHYLRTGDLDPTGLRDTFLTEAIGNQIGMRQTDKPEELAAIMAAMPVKAASLPFMMVPPQVFETVENVASKIIPGTEPGVPIAPSLENPRGFNQFFYNELAPMTTPGNVAMAAVPIGFKGAKMAAPKIPGIREFGLAREINRAPLIDTPPVIPEAALSVATPDILPSAMQTPWGRSLADLALEQAQGRDILRPGEVPAMELLRREIEPPQIVTGEPIIRVERPGGGPAQGGRVSFAGEAAAEGIPSARQAALKGAQDATGKRPITEGGESQRQQASERGIPPEAERSNRTGKSGDEPPAPAAEVVPATPPKPPASPAVQKLQEGLKSERPTNALTQEVGLTVKTLDELSAIEQMFDQASTDALAARASGDLNTAMATAYRKQLLRETIETATNTGSWKEGTGRNALGERPLDIAKNPEAAAWLRERGGKLGIEVEAPKLEPVAPKAEPIAAEPVVEAVSSLDPASGVPLSATDALIGKLERLKVSNNPGALFSLPDPRIFESYGKAFWNTGIDVAITAIRAGRTAAQALEAAWERLQAFAKERGMSIDERGVRANLESILREETGAVPPANRPSGTTAAGGAAISEPVQSGAKAMADAGASPAPKQNRNPEDLEMRKLSERGTTAPSIPKPVQEQIATAPESFYKPQSVREVTERVRNMDDGQLSQVSKESDVYTAAQLERANRAFDAGNDAAGYEIFQSLSEELTRLGQVINQAKLLQSVRPENVVRILNQRLRKSGRDPLTTEQAGRVERTAKDRMQKQRDLDDATDAWKKDPTDANAAAAEAKLVEANKAALEEQKLVNGFQTRSTAQLIKSIMQGNLLAPISQVANLVGNVSFLPFRAGTRAGAALIDMVDATLRNRPREVGGARVSDTVSGLIRGVNEIPGILARGTGDVIKGEARAGLHPLRAWVKQFAKNPDIPTVGGRIPFSERVNLAIEGTLGIPAEPMLRLLASGDAPFREAARARLISEAGKLQGLTPDQMRMARKFPQLFFDGETIARIKQESLAAVFQRQSETLTYLMTLIKKKGDWFDLAIASVMPYKVTPWNIVGEILSYNPLIAMGRTALEAKRGNIRSAEMNAAKILVGSTLSYAGFWLYNKGLLSPSMDQKDERQKARLLTREVMPPNHINVSGLKRALAGEDPAFQKGDKTVDIFRGGGLAGAFFYMAANIGRDSETEPESDSMVLSTLKNSTIEQARFGMNQSFLKGVANLIRSVEGGDTDTYVQQYANTVLSVPLPNTLSALSRSQRKFQVDVKADEFPTQMANLLRARLGLDSYLPVKRGLWGEPLPQRPEGANAMLYEFFDISKGQRVTEDPVATELYRLWRKTASTEVIPTPPGKTVTVEKVTYALTPQQQSRLAELIGVKRRESVDSLVLEPEYHAASDQEKIDVLRKLYDQGRAAGVEEFWTESGNDLTPKAEKVGFTPK